MASQKDSYLPVRLVSRLEKLKVQAQVTWLVACMGAGIKIEGKCISAEDLQVNYLNDVIVFCLAEVSSTAHKPNQPHSVVHSVFPKEHIYQNPCVET